LAESFFRVESSELVDVLIIVVADWRLAGGDIAGRYFAPLVVLGVEHLAGVGHAAVLLPADQVNVFPL
jgi:hypothetical protein